jgi:hypothetical protein
MTAPMRAAVTCLLLLAATEQAAADRVCYAGTQTRETAGLVETHALVVVRDVDRDAREIREQSFTAADGEHARTVVYKVDAKAGTFELRLGSARGKGTLEGSAWKWTAAHAEVLRPKMKMVVDTKIGASSLGQTARAEIAGRVATVRWEATAFDCKELDQRKRALDPTSSPTAKRGCYAGTATKSDGTKVPTVLVQIVDRARIEVRYRFDRMKNDRIDVITIDGDKTLVDGTTPAKLTGKPDAWTGYAWTSKGKVLEVAVEGTLGGNRVTHKVTMSSARAPETFLLEATKFDCTELAAKRAALTPK